MKSQGNSFTHLTGVQAYLIYWIQVYDCRPKLTTIMAIDQNLELFVNEHGEILKYRFDYPDEMKGMVSNAGQWQTIE